MTNDRVTHRERSETMRKTHVLIAIVLGMLVVVLPSAFGQEFGGIKGVVKDDGGNPIPGAVVTLTGSKIVKMSGVTKEGGNFRFLSLPVADDYVLKVELQGFKTVVHERLAVAFG